MVDVKSPNGRGVANAIRIVQSDTGELTASIAKVALYRDIVVGVESEITTIPVTPRYLCGGFTILKGDNLSVIGLYIDGEYKSDDLTDYRGVHANLNDGVGYRDVFTAHEVQGVFCKSSETAAPME